MHVDTGHNFPEVIEFRDRRVAELGARLVVASVQDVDRPGPGRRGDRAPGQPQPAADHARCSTPSRSTASTPCSAAPAATRRRPGPRSGCTRFRDEFGQWDPKNQRPELWSLYNGRHRQGEHIRVFPLSNWTELDIWQYIGDEDIELPSIYFAHRARGLPARRHAARRQRRSSPLPDGEEPFEMHGALPHRRRRVRAPARSSPPPPPSTRSSPRSPPPASPSGAPPAPTTGSPRRPWKTASSEGYF